MQRSGVSVYMYICVCARNHIITALIIISNYGNTLYIGIAMPRSIIAVQTEISVLITRFKNWCIYVPATETLIGQLL